MDHSAAGKKGYAKVSKVLDKCRQKRHDEAVRKHEQAAPKCKLCGEPLPYEKRYGKFCNHSCAGKYVNFTRHRVIKDPRYCAACGKPSGKNKYCRDCIDEGVHLSSRRKKLEDIKNSANIRRYLLRTREYRCASCGRKTWMGQKIPLEVDHVDGDHKNNTEENLRLICPNCHALTPTYKALNKGRGRPNRK